MAVLDERTVGFTVAAYDRDHALIIDPTLVYAGYIGGVAVDRGFGIAVDSAGTIQRSTRGINARHARGLFAFAHEHGKACAAPRELFQRAFRTVAGAAAHDDGAGITFRIALGHGPGQIAAHRITGQRDARGIGPVVPHQFINICVGKTLLLR